MLTGLLGAGLSGAAGADANAGAFWAQNQALNNDSKTSKHLEDAAKNGGVFFAVDNLLAQGPDQWLRNFFSIGSRDANKAESDPNRQIDSTDGPRNNGPSAPSPVTAAVALRCLAGGPVGCVVAAILGALVPPSSPPPSNWTFSSGNSEGGNPQTKPTTDAVSVSGNRAIDKSQSYEKGVRQLYDNATFQERQFTTIVDGVRVNGVADDVAKINGRFTAVEAKFADDWASSIRNPESPIGGTSWAKAEQQRMLAQAKSYASAFEGGVVYHTNSVELANYYTKVFVEGGVKNFKFVITPVK
ncbi:tRNA nuclease CdiA-2 [Pandoraea anapnoica]|uniref:tRNA nuclease CdiA-2 n=1 Tax=Pandoraea anapnoica TaxID=2508301 RepID=A0A5E5AS45_9BURK|nr:tRNA nuclease CdiA-2 [Pandoraea anapnoica]